jgi:hypothetical protein
VTTRRARLRRAAARGSLVSLTCTLTGAELTAIVISVGLDWVLLQPVTHCVDFDGHLALRIEHIDGLGTAKRPAWYRKVLLARGLRPSPPRLPTESLEPLLSAAARRNVPLCVHRLRQRPKRFLVGTATEVDAASCVLTTVETTLRTGSRRVPLHRIVRVEPGGTYACKVMAVARQPRKRVPRKRTFRGAAAVAAVKRAMKREAIVRIWRRALDPYPLDVVPVSLGKESLLVDVVSDRLDLDDRRVLRLADITSVVVGSPDHLIATAARPRRRHRVLTGLPLDDSGSLLHHLASRGDITAIRREALWPDECAIGQITEVRALDYSLRPVDTRGRFTHVEASALADVTCVSFDSYCDALALTARRENKPRRRTSSSIDSARSCFDSSANWMPASSIASIWSPSMLTRGRLLLSADGRRGRARWPRRHRGSDRVESEHDHGVPRESLPALPTCDLVRAERERRHSVSGL